MSPNESTLIDQVLKDTIAVIPMWNEEDSIALVLQDLPPLRQVIVVDNGSTDRGPEIARSHQATVVSENRRGYGAACLAGLAHIASMTERGGPVPTAVMFLDADYSDHPEEASQVIAPIANDQAELVIGSRMRGHRERGAMPFQAAFGNWLASTLMWLLWGAKFTDLGPFRAITYPALQSLNMQDRNFGWTVEMQIKAVQKKLRYTEVPVSYRRRIGVSKISGTISGTFRAGYKILYTIFKYRFRRN